MTFEEQAAELRRLEAVAMSLSVSDAEFVRIAQDAIAAGGGGTAARALLTEIRRRIHVAGHRRQTLVSTEDKAQPPALA